MKTNIEFKVDVLTALMQEDRQEIRDIRSAIYNRLYVLTASSFALASFLLKEGELSPARLRICLVTDLVIILLLWILFHRLKKDLYSTRQCLEAREELINQLDEANTDNLNVFPDATQCADGTERVPKIRDTEVIWIPVFSTAAVMVKMVILAFI